MMGNGFQGAMDPRMLMMQMQMQKQGPAMAGGPMGQINGAGLGGMGGAMGMRSPNAQMPQAPQPQPQGQQQHPMQGMNMQMLMEALKRRQQGQTQFPNTPGGQMAKVPGNQVDPMFGGTDPSGQSQSSGGGGGGGGVMDFLKYLSPIGILGSLIK